MKNDGGPAFPVTFEHSYGVDCGTKSQEWQGMSLRDYFMAHAPAAEIADLVPSDVKGCAAYIGIEPTEYVGNEHYCRVLAKARCKWADAMLAERAKSLTSKE